MHEHGSCFERHSTSFISTARRIGPAATEAALGTLLVHRGRNESALQFFDSALRNLHPALDEVAYGMTLSNRAFSLMLVGRLDAAKATYAKALGFARRLNLKTALFSIRYGLAQIELKKGQAFKALNSFVRIAEDARSEGLDQRVLSAELRVPSASADSVRARRC